MPRKTAFIWVEGIATAINSNHITHVSAYDDRSCDVHLLDTDDPLRVCTSAEYFINLIESEESEVSLLQSEAWLDKHNYLVKGLMKHWIKTYG